MYINGDVEMIVVTDRAAAELKVLLGNADISGMPIRIYITGSIADAQYGLALADDITDYDVEMENNGIKLVMDKDVAAGFTDGSIDFVYDANGKNFIIQNAESGTCSNCDECDVCDIE
jgi:Fe-S cluster assembly iron-binding protein IscA